MSPRRQTTTRYESLHAGYRAASYFLAVVICAYRVSGQDATRLEDAIRIEFTLESPDGLYFSPDPLALTVKIDNHSEKGFELGASFELVDDRVDSAYVLQRYQKVIPIDGKGTVPQSIEFASPPPGFYRVICTVNDRLKKDIVLGYEPEEIVSPLTREADFEQFWKTRKQELAAVAPEYEVVNSDRSSDDVAVYLVTMQSYGHVHIRGWYTVPACPGPHPAILSLPGYTSTMWPYMDRRNVATFALNPRGHGNSKDDLDPEGQEYMFIGFDPGRPQAYIYTGAYLDCIRAVDFLVSRPEIDALRIGVEGASQGGGLALATAALDCRVMFCAPDVPWLGDWMGYLETADWPRENYPKLMESYPHLTFAGINRLLSYFDTMNMAEWIECPVLMSVGLQDDVCPPRIAFGSYNAVRSKKEYRVYPLAGHDAWRDHRRFKDQWMANRVRVDRITNDHGAENLPDGQASQ